MWLTVVEIQFGISHHSYNLAAVFPGLLVCIAGMTRAFLLLQKPCLHALCLTCAELRDNCHLYVPYHLLFYRPKYCGIPVCYNEFPWLCKWQYESDSNTWMDIFGNTDMRTRVLVQICTCIFMCMSLKVHVCLRACTELCAESIHSKYIWTDEPKQGLSIWLIINLDTDSSPIINVNAYYYTCKCSKLEAFLRPAILQEFFCFL